LTDSPVAAIRAIAAHDCGFDRRDNLRPPSLAPFQTAGADDRALKGPIRPEQLRRKDVIDPPGKEMFFGDRHERLGALAENADSLRHLRKLALTRRGPGQFVRLAILHAHSN
jgi:hypothetical protein